MAEQHPSETSAEATQRPRAAELDRILGVPLRVLDDGFVRVVDYMGTDASIVQAARVSYTLQTADYGPEQQRHLIRYLMRHRHTSPFEMCEIKLHVRVPMDCWRQWIRHRTASVNEYSTRYSEAIDSAQRTAPGEWRTQSATNKQGSAGFLEEPVGGRLTQREEELQQLARQVYQERLDAGVAKEQARKDLPLSTYTEAFWKIDLHNLLHFLSLRMDAHAQQEIRAYAQVIGNEVASRWCPVTWAAFQEYRLEGMTLTGAEVEIMQAMMKGDAASAITSGIRKGMLGPDGKPIEKHRERSELEQKLDRLGVKAPWR